MENYVLYYRDNIVRERLTHGGHLALSARAV